MTDKHVDDAKGRVKEAAGALTGDQELKHEGKVDQARSRLKDKADHAADAAVQAAEKVKEHLSRH